MIQEFFLEIFGETFNMVCHKSNNIILYYIQCVQDVKKSLMGSDLTPADLRRDMVSFEPVSYFNT